MTRLQRTLFFSTTWAIAAVAAVVLWGCGSQQPAVKSVATAPTVPVRDSMKALEFFVEGAMHDLKGEFAEAILEYEEAYRFDNAAPIAFACAKDYYELHKGQRAAHYADAAIARDSTNTVYHQLRARIAMNLQTDFNEAQRQFEAILAYDSLDTQTLSELASLYQFRGQPRRAAELYERLMDIIGADGDVGSHLVQLYIELNDFPRAVAVLEDCLREDPDDASLRETLAKTFLAMRKTDSAVVLFRDLVERYPDDASSRHILADIYSGTGRWPEAFVQYKLLCDDSTVAGDTLNTVLDSLYGHLRVDSTVADTIFTVLADVAEDDTTLWYPCVLCAGACLFVHDDSAAIEWVHEAVRRTTDTTITLVLAAQLFLERQHFSEVLAITKDAQHFHDFRLFLLRAYALSRLHRQDEAIASLYSSLEIFPRNWLALGELGLYHEEQKRYGVADSAFNAALALKPDYAVVLNNYSYSLAERGQDLDRALEMSRRSLELDPENANYLDTYGWILFKMARLDSSVVYLQRANDLPSPSPGVIEHLGDVKYQLGQVDVAMQLWNRAYKLDEHNDALRDKIKERSAGH